MVGQQIGSYLIERKLGAGGMGIVYVGVDLRLGRRAAIKQLLPELSTNRDIVERFFNEAKAAAQINHPGIVEIYDVGWHVDGTAYFAMKLLEGESLAGRLHHGPLPIGYATTIARQAGSALAAAHAAGIVHRDLKPDNLVLVRDDEVAIGERAILLDFGIAKLFGERTTLQVTRTASVMGTPAYMSPEQCRGAGDVDHRTDIYALGCILFEMLCGRRPFVGVSPGEEIGMHQFVEPPSVRSLRGDVPPELDAVVMRCLAKKPEQRYPTMPALLAALQPFAAIAPRDSLPSPTVPPRREAVVAKPPSRWLGLVIGVVGGGIVVVTATMLIAIGRCGSGSERAADARIAIGNDATLGGDANTVNTPPCRDAMSCRAACDRDDQESCVRLAKYMYDGTGIAKDLRAAHQLVAAACERDVASGCAISGADFNEGAGVVKNTASAAKAWARACALGDMGSCGNVGTLQERGDGVNKDLTAALASYHQGCEGGWATHCLNEGQLLMDGRGAKRNLSAAKARFERACDLKGGNGCNNLGNLYLFGNGVAKDARKALELYQAGCDYDSAVACFNLGAVYRDGDRGIAVDRAQAKVAFEKGCKGGDRDACDALRQ